MPTQANTHCLTQPNTNAAPAQSNAASGPANANANANASSVSISKHTKQLTDFEKGKIVFAYEQGWGYQE